MTTLAAPPATCESGAQSCVSDQRPGPQPASDSFTANEIAAQRLPFIADAAPPIMA